MLALVTCTMNTIQPSAGGGVETGNTKAIGRVVAMDSISLHTTKLHVCADVWDNGTTPRYEAWASPNDSGYYSFDSLPNGRYRVSGVDSGGGEGFTRTFATVMHLDSIFVGTDSLRKVGTVRGKLTRYDGSSPAGITVGLRGTSFKQTITGDGTFDFPRVPPGEQILVAQASWLYKGVPQLQTITVAPGETTFVSFFLPAEHTFMLNILPGQVWSYRYEWRMGPSVPFGLPDSSWNGGYVYYAYMKDTLINDLLFNVINQYDYGSCGDRTIIHGTGALYVGIHADTVLLYESYGTAAMPTLLKRTAGSMVASSAGLANPVKILYDTAAFSDFRVPIIFNNAPNSPWYSRPLADRNLPLVQRYVGNEIVTVPGGTFNCMRMEWEWADSSPVKGVNYVSDIGNVKQIIDDTAYYRNGIFDTSSFQYRAEYIGTDTTGYQRTFPRLPQNIHDSIQNQVLGHWSIARYRRWIQAIDTSGDIMLFNTTSDKMYSLIWAMHPEWNLHIEEFHLLADSIYHMPDPLTVKDIGNIESFVSLLIGPSTKKDYMQGWDDCNWDFTTQGLYNPSDTLEPYGHSAWPQALFGLMDGYYMYVNQ